MATVTTTVTPEPMATPFTGLTDPVREISEAPRQAIVFHSSFTIAATGAGDNQALQVNCNLPQNFGFALLDTRLTITTTVAGTYNWRQGHMTFLQDANSQADASVVIPITIWCEDNLHTSDVQRRVFLPNAPLPQQIMQARTGDFSKYTMSLFNTAANDVEYSGDVYVRFLMYDIRQVDHYLVNTPMLTRG